MDMLQKKKIGIIGLGPVGMILAVKFKEAGFHVVLCDNNKVKVDLIKHQGITLENVINKTMKFKTIYSSIEALHNENLDFLIISVKSYQAEQILDQLAYLNHENLTVIAAQNGIDVEEVLFDVFNESQIIRMVINYAGNLVAPNIVRVTFFNPPNYLGSIDDTKRNEAEFLARSLTEVKMETHPVTSFEILKRTWEKTILNASLSALCGVGRLTMAEAMNDPDTVELIEQIIKEAIEVAEAEKIRFPDDFIRNCLRYLKKGGNHFPSLAGDLINNRETEINYFNGKIVEYGRKHYLRTSLNLAFTNMVKAMTNKNISSRIPGIAGSVSKRIIESGLIKGQNKKPVYQNGGDCFLGVDLGSAYTKFTVIDDEGHVVFRYLLQTLTGDKLAMKHIMQAIHSDFNIAYSCATGYGRKHFSKTNIVKTEINCAVAGVSHYHSGSKNIIDIGGEDIKIIRCDEQDNIDNFYMNDKCAAGTGSFITEIAERTNINLIDMSNLAAQSDFTQELNSFCTVFAKTEIMKWMFDGMKVEDISKGVYLSIANRVAKLKIDTDLPVFMIGGVIAFHPYLREMLHQKIKSDIKLIEHPQHIVSLGAALIAQRYYNRKILIESGEKVKEPIVS
jgi:(R)-2-hydroxyacyl-CoA dehydratese activating ATPase